MPPFRTASDPTAKRKPPPFKPPRPVKDFSASTATAKPGRPRSNNSAASASRPSAKAPSSRPTKKAPNARSGFKPASTTLVSSDEASDDGEDEDRDVSDVDEDDEDDNSQSRRASRPAAPASAAAVPDNPFDADDAPPPIPQQLLTRLLYEGFEDKNMKIGKQAMAVVGKYMEIFVREAIARAALEREEADKESGMGDGFLQVEDLEKLAPQLLLDF